MASGTLRALVELVALLIPVIVLFIFRSVKEDLRDELADCQLGEVPKDSPLGLHAFAIVNAYPPVLLFSQQEELFALSSGSMLLVAVFSVQTVRYWLKSVHWDRDSPDVQREGWEEPYKTSRTYAAVSFGFTIVVALSAILFRAQM